MTYKAEKALTEKLDYTIDYSALLNDSDPEDHLVSSLWVVFPSSGGLTVVSDGIIDSKKATIWVSGGGVLGSVFKLINHVTCISAREYQRTISLKIVPK